MTGTVAAMADTLRGVKARSADPAGSTGSASDGTPTVGTASSAPVWTAAQQVPPMVAGEAGPQCPLGARRGERSSSQPRVACVQPRSAGGQHNAKTLPARLTVTSVTTPISTIRRIAENAMAADLNVNPALSDAQTLPSAQTQSERGLCDAMAHSFRAQPLLLHYTRSIGAWHGRPH